MTPRSHFEELSNTEGELDAFCKRAGTHIENYKQLALYGGHVSGVLAVRLARASDGKMTVEEILDPKDRRMIAARKKRAARERARRASRAA